MSCEVNNNCIPLMPTYVENTLPSSPVKTAIYFIKNGSMVKMYVTDASGNPYLINESIPEHNLLSNLQGGQAGQYYHLTQSEYEQIQNIIGEGFILTVNGISPDGIGNVSVNADSVFEEGSTVNVTTPINMTSSNGTESANTTLNPGGYAQLSSSGQLELIGNAINFNLLDGTTVPTVNATDNITISVNGIAADTQGNINLTSGGVVATITGNLVNNTDSENPTVNIFTTDYSLYYDSVTGEISANTSDFEEGFTWNTGDPQIFTLAFEPTEFNEVTGNGQKLDKFLMEYQFIPPNQVEILNTLNDGDRNLINYEHYIIQP